MTEEGRTTIVRLDRNDELEAITALTRDVKVRAEYVTVYQGEKRRIHTPWVRVIEVIEQ